MAKGETKKTNAIIQQNLERDRNEGDTELNVRRGLRNTEETRNQNEYDRLSGILDSRYNTGGLSDDDLARLRGLGNEAFGGGGGGGAPDWSRYGNIESFFRDSLDGKTVDVDRLRAGQPLFREFMQTGGFSPDQLSSIGRDLGVLQGIGLTGGLDPYSMERMRGNGVYEEFANTGGYSDADKSLIRDRATAPINSVLDSNRRNLNRLGRVSGANTAAALAKSTRDVGRLVADTNRTAELDIADRVRQGRLSGAQGLASSEGALQQLRTGNMLQGIMGALQFQNQFGNTLANNRFQGASALGESELPIQNMLTDARRYGAENLMSFLRMQDSENQAAASRGAANARASLDNEWDIINFQDAARRQAMAGYGELFNTSGNNKLGYTDSLDRNRGANQFGGNSAVEQRIAANPHWSQVFGNVIGPIAGGASAAAGAFQPSPYSRRRQPQLQPDYSDQYYGG